MPFEIVRNDITKMQVDAIVNAANRTLLGGGGVDGAIHQAAGPELLAECRTLGGCETGEAKITRGYRLPAKYVIHTVGPVWQGGLRGERKLLLSCYQNALRLALDADCESIAFPMISAGAYGYPKNQALAVAVEAISHFLLEHEMMIYLVVFGHEELLNGKKLFQDIKEYVDDVYVEHLLQSNRQSERQSLWHRNRKTALERDSEYALRFSEAAPKAQSSQYPLPVDAISAPDWESLLQQTDEGFSQALLRLIDERGMTDVECYKRANVDRKLFSKIRSNPAYKPSKATVFAFAVALRLNLAETERLLQRAGFAISHSSRFDIIIEYFIKAKNYDIYEINEVLFDYDMPLLGSSLN